MAPLLRGGCPRWRGLRATPHRPAIGICRSHRLGVADILTCIARLADLRDVSGGRSSPVIRFADGPARVAVRDQRAVSEGGVPAGGVSSGAPPCFNLL